MKQLFTITFFLISSLSLTAQSTNKIIQNGNEQYKQSNFVGAQKNYLDALSKNPENEAATYNLGNSFYQQRSFDEAIDRYKKIAETSSDPKLKAEAYHNLGNTLMEQKKYDESVTAYKQSLHNNPEDADTKYNLAYAQSMLQKQQQQQQKNDKQDNKKQQNNQQQDQQNKQNPADKKNQQQQQQPKQFTKDELDRIMEALNADDKNVQDKVNKQKVQAAGSGTDKDW